MYPSFMFWAACFGSTSILPKIFPVQGGPALIAVVVSLVAMDESGGGGGGESVHFAVGVFVGAVVLSIAGLEWKKRDKVAREVGEQMLPEKK